MLPETLTYPESFSSSPRIDKIRDDFPDPTVPTTLNEETGQVYNIHVNAFAYSCK